MAAESERLQNPENEKLVEKVKHIRKWKNAYRQWGRTTMGFGLYVFLVEE